MKILFWQWHSFMGKGMERALHRLNIAYDTFFYQMNDWESDDRFAEQLEKRISQQAYDAVISVNFNPIISDVCQNHKLPYRAWVYDSPIHIRNVQALKNSYTKVYFFDRGQAEEYQRQGINAGYLPLAADVETFYPVMEELHGNRQPDTDEYLLSIIKGMNWEIQVLNGTMDYLNEIEQLIDKQAANALFVNFSKIYQKKDDEKLAEVFEKDMIPFFEKLEEVAKVKMN